VTEKLTEAQMTIFPPEVLEGLDKTKIPHHIAIIPDGNRRWAKQQLKKVTEGHFSGADTLPTIVKAAKELGVKVVTVYSFSTENWRRNQHEISTLMYIYESYLRRLQAALVEYDIRFSAIGDRALLPKTLIDVIEQTESLTASCGGLDLVLALNYGGRDELLRAIKKVAQNCVEGKIKPSDITEELFTSMLDTHRFPDPDLVIRTSGEERLSNFLLWQNAYAELYTEKEYWPGFTPQHLLRAILEYQARDRRRGGGV
jgi:undecaprenyl diphosphate synthase